MSEEPSAESRAAHALDHAGMAAAAREIVAAAEPSGLKIRAVGGVAVWERLSPGSRTPYQGKRPVPRDVDLLAERKSSKAVRSLFEGLAFAPDDRLIAWHGDRRHRYFRLDGDGQPLFEVDVFIGSPPLCHEIEFADRLETSGFVMEPTDLLLQKLQVHEATEKDLIDASYLLADYPTGSGGSDKSVDAARIAQLTAEDWGFHHTATTNLQRMADALGDLLHEAAQAPAAEHVRELVRAIEDEPKSRRWKMRARVGTKMRWYEDVEELVR